jgi:uncharacterized OB-fold protein/acyl dehydratase
MSDSEKSLTSADKVAFLAQLRAFEGRQIGAPQPATDPVNQPMIRHWVEAMGDENPVYVDQAAAVASGRPGVIAPPTMLQAWCMRGVKPRPADGGNEQDRLLRLLDAAGFTSVVATNCEQEYARELHLGDQLSLSVTIESVSEEKSTALGAGHFVTTRQTYTDQSGAVVGTQLFRIFKFRPRERAVKPGPRPLRPRPAITRDSAFWFDAVKQKKLLIQRCTSCGALRHPPRPMCPRCQSLEWGTIESSGRGVVYSYVVNHYPQVPAFDYPLAVALIELEEGTRLVANVVGIDPAAIRIGMPVEAELVVFDDELALPQFRPTAKPGA